MTDLAKLVVRLEAETARYSAELDRAKKQLGGFEKDTNAAIKKIGKGTAVAAVAAATGLAVMVKSSIDAADQMSKLAQSTGISTRTLSELAYAGQLADVSNEELAKSLSKLAKTAVDAAEGGKQQAAAFKAAGVTVKESSGQMRATDEILLDIAERFSQLEDGAGKAALAQDLFGKSGAKLIPFLNQGRDGIEELREEAVRLGLSLSDEVGQQAEEFNDNLTRLKSVATGFATSIAAELLPNLVLLSDEFVNSAEKSQLFQDVSRSIATIVKGIVDAALGAATAFQKLGNAIGATAAAAVQAAQLNFEAAGEIWRQATEDNVALEAEYQRMRVALWSDAGKKIVDTANDTDEALKGSLSFGMGGGLQEIQVSAKKIEIGPMEEFYKELDQMTMTNTERALEGIEAQKAALEELRAARRVSEDEYAARIESIKKAEEDALGITERLQEAEDRRKQIMEEGQQVFEATRTPLEEYNAELDRLSILLNQGAIDQETFNRAAGMAKEELNKASDSIFAFLDEAKRNSQDILGQGIYDSIKSGADRGADAALDTFKDMILRMIAEAAAAQAMKLLFGGDSQNTPGGGSGGGGLWDDVAQWGMSLMSRDSGGRGRKGGAYAIGRGVQPEMFFPDTSGTFIPRDQWMSSSQKVTQNIYVEGRVDQRSARQLELEAARRQNAAASRLG